MQRSSISGRNFETGSSKSRNSFEPGLSPFGKPDITPRQSSRAMSGNFVMSAADIENRAGQRSVRRSLDRNSLDKSLRGSQRQSGQASGRNSERNSRRLSMENTSHRNK